ncbi:MarR family transcriptional regulator [Paenalkalicoccus suaedae]|uniref:MarR family transcriptional regulator n=1 Tax=Paenalkalicoccus suaedae TaxID=2592382 RepID=A0A859FBI1_9BACI|nr:MarR family transcriptional regulator [Paenalkalicoccus suaedae]QKS70152.1 MarR family transcriptional regulator [Paenalkalicoccus suaedae]
MNRNMEEIVGYQLGVVTHLLHNKYQSSLAEHDLTRAQLKVLYLLNKFGEQSQLALSKKLFIQGSTMNGIIESMLKKNLIEKHESKEDRRSKLVTITSAGKELEEKMWQRMLDSEEELLKGFSKEEIQIIHSFLKRMKANVQEEE